jgi:beta-aspartyl-peptidase (threonine type)
MSAPTGTAAVVLHAGAGSIGAELRECEQECRAALAEALGAASALLHDGGDALDAVRAAVTVMEDFPLFNSGRGAALCTDGSAQLSAALMRGSDRAAGAVAGISHTQNPIAAAGAVLQSEQVLMIAAGADERAAAAGLAQQPNEYFVTARQQARLQSSVDPDRGTVGAVCLDAKGVLAAGTSTGGVRAQPPGRVGDSPLIGAGTWADGRVAVSCTGDGEAFIRTGAARQIAMQVEFGTPIRVAVERALVDVATLGANGGIIALDAEGVPAMVFGTAAMPRALWRAGSEPSIWVAP